MNQDAVPLEEVCERYFGLSPTEAKKRAPLQELPVPVFRLGSQRSPWMVSSKHLADLIVKKAKEAEGEHRAVNG